MNKRKKLFITWICLLTLLPSSATAEIIKNGLRYNITSTSEHTVEVAGLGNTDVTFPLTIPPTIEHEGVTYTVTAIGKSAFSNLGSFTISLPSTIRVIKAGAFSGSGLRYLDIPEGTDSVQESAIECELQSLTIPSTLKYWGAGNVFNSNKSFTSIKVADGNPIYDSRDNCNAIVETATNMIVQACNGTTIPDGIVGIGPKAFGRLILDSLHVPESLKSIDYSMLNCRKLIVNSLDEWCSVDCQPYRPYKNYYNFSYHPIWFEELYVNNELITDLTFPASVKIIRNFFTYDKLQSVVIPSTAQEIGNFAFYDCRSLKKVTIENGITSIGTAAFSGCTGLTKIRIPSSVKRIREDAFKDCKSIAMVIAEHTEPAYITKSVFSDETYQNAVLYVPQGCKDAYAADTYGWGYFKNIVDEIPDENINFQFMADGLAYHVISVEDKEVELIPPSQINSSAGAYRGDVVIPATVTDSDNGITYTVTKTDILAINGTAITSIKFPSTIRRMESYLPSNGCKIYIDDIAAWCKTDFHWKGAGVIPRLNNTSARYPLFVNGQEVTHLEIPDGVTSISEAAFYGFTIKGITLPASVKRVDNVAFKSTSLESLVIPSTLQEIGFGAFSNCSNLQSLTIEEGIKEIGPTAFGDCTALTKISLPGSVKRIHDFAFRGCINLTEVTLPEGLERIDEWAFAWCTRLPAISTPASLRSIGRNAFTACRELATVTLSEGLEHIGRYAFNRCTSLRTLQVPASVNAIERSIIEDCHSLQSLSVAGGNPKYDSREQCNAIIETATNTLVAATTGAAIPSDIQTIGDHALAYCTDRQSIELPEGLKRIGHSAFLHCWSLHTVTIPESTDSIGPKAFDACESFTEVIAKAAQPCAIDDMSFTANTYRTTTLYVPDEAVERYREARGWKRFARIEGASAHLASISPITDHTGGDVQIAIGDHRVWLSNLSANEPVSVYSLRGQLLKTIKAAPDGRAVLVLPTSGTYIVQTPRKSVKVKL